MNLYFPYIPRIKSLRNLTIHFGKLSFRMVCDNHNFSKTTYFGTYT